MALKIKIHEKQVHSVYPQLRLSLAAVTEKAKISNYPDFPNSDLTNSLDARDFRCLYLMERNDIGYRIPQKRLFRLQLLVLFKTSVKLSKITDVRRSIYNRQHKRKT